jgi:hypothetical protein
MFDLQIDKKKEKQKNVVGVPTYDQTLFEYCNNSTA